MKKLLRRILLSLGIFIGVVLLAAIILPFVFRDKIEAAIKAEVNKNLLADVEWGRWQFSLLRSFPNLTASVNDLVVTNRAPFDSLRLADIGKASITLDIKSLWSDELDILRFSLDEPNLYVKVLEDGRANYNITKPADDAETSPFHIKLKTYAIQNGHIVYQDQKQSITAELYDLDHTGSGDFTQDRFTLKTETGVGKLDVRYGSITYVRQAAVDLAADIEVDVPTSTYRFSENQVSINELVLGFEGWLQREAGKGYNMEISWDTKRSDLSSLLSLVPAAFASDLKGVDMSGKAAFSGVLKGRYHGDILPAFTLQADVENGQFQYPDLPQRAENIQLDLHIEHPGGSNLDAMLVDLRRLNMTLAGNPLEARMTLRQTISDPNINAALKTRMDLSTLKQVVPISEELSGRLDADVKLNGALSDIEAQRYDRFQAEGQLNIQDMAYRGEEVPMPLAIRQLLLEFSPRYLSLERFDGDLGNSAIRASGRLDNYLQWWLKDEMLQGQFDVFAGRVDLNEWAGSEESGAVAEKEATSPDDAPSMQVIEVPANIDFTLTATADEVLYDNLELKNVRGQVVIRDQVANLRDLVFQLLGADVTVNGAYDTRSAQAPEFDLQYAIRNLDLALAAEAIPTLDKLAPVARHCKGRFNSTLRLSGLLDGQMAPLMNTLEGRGNLQSSALQVQGFEPLTQLASALKIQELAQTEIRNLNLSFKMEDGKLVTEPFELNFNRFKATTGGFMTIADQAIRYDMSTKIPTALFGVDGKQTVGGLLGLNNQALAGFSVPEFLDATIQFTGTVRQPVVKPVFAGGMQNLVETVVEEAKEELNEQIDQTKAEAIAKAKAERDRLIAEAQKQADQIKAKAREEAGKVKAAAYNAADAELAKVKNPVAKAGAKVVADKAKQEADKKEQQAIAEADKRADAVVEAARKQGDELVRKAEESNTTVR